MNKPNNPKTKKRPMNKWSNTSPEARTFGKAVPKCIKLLASLPEQKTTKLQSKSRRRKRLAKTLKKNESAKKS